MEYKTTLRALMLASFLFGASSVTEASESDPWTYAYIPLADSATLVSNQLGILIQSVNTTGRLRYSGQQST